MSQPENSSRSEIPREVYPQLTRRLMRRQAALSVRVAAVFLLLLFLLPLLNYFVPDLANARIAGFTATWLFLGVLFYPITWLLSWYFIRASDRIEQDSTDWRKLTGDSSASGSSSNMSQSNSVGSSQQ